jgi:hypothetical protein
MTRSFSDLMKRGFDPEFRVMMIERKDGGRCWERVQGLRPGDRVAISPTVYGTVYDIKIHPVAGATIVAGAVATHPILHSSGEWKTVADLPHQPRFMLTWPFVCDIEIEPPAGWEGPVCVYSPINNVLYSAIAHVGQ